MRVNEWMIPSPRAVSPETLVSEARGLEYRIGPRDAMEAGVPRGHDAEPAGPEGPR